MRIETRHLVYISLALLAGIVLYLTRSILTPFLFAAGFAYFLNPLVGFLTRRVKLPKSLAVGIIYVTVVSVLTAAIFIVSTRISEESLQFSHETKTIIENLNEQINLLPSWLAPIATDALESVKTTLLLPHRRVFSYLPGAIHRTISLLVFLVASFYFLKDGHYFIRGFLNLLPRLAGKELEAILGKINGVLGSYLRGQLLLIAIMSVLTFVGLNIIGVRYALFLSVFTGFAEIIPFVGPVVAAAVAMFISYTDQVSRISPNPLIDVVAVASLYVVLRQIEDLFIIPQIMGRITKLHPLVVLFAVLAGGRLFGLVGYLAAVPLAASLKVALEHLSRLLESSPTKKAP